MKYILPICIYWSTA